MLYNYLRPACLAVSYFSTLSHKRHDLRKDIIECKMCVLIFSTNLSTTFLVVSGIEPDVNIRTDIWKYSFVNRTIKNWNRLPAEFLWTFLCKSKMFRNRIRKVIEKGVK